MRAHSVFSFAVVLVVSLFASVAFSSGPPVPKMKEVKLEPASRYSGPVPIDLKNGIPGNNGTYGLPNAPYEEFAKTKKVVPGINDAAYTFEQKTQLLTALDEQVMWGESAIANWKNGSPAKEEQKAHNKQAVDTMEPLLGKLKDATKSANGAGKNDWASAEEGARKALSDFRAAYKGLHNNVATK